MAQIAVRSLFVGFAVAGMLLTPAPAGALPPLPGDKDADGVSDQDEINIYHSDQRGHRRRWAVRHRRVLHLAHDALSRVDAGTKPLDHASHPGATADQGQGPAQNRPDTDKDGLFNDDETNVYGTNPNKADTDGDGRDDGQEVFDNTDPNNPFG